MRKLTDLIRRMPLACTALVLMALLGTLLLLLPKADFSELENRSLSTMHGRSPLDDDFDTAAETWISDHFPGRSALVQAHAAATAALGRIRQDGVLLLPGGRLMEEPVRAVTATARMAADTLNEVASALQLPMTVLLIPTSEAVLPLPPLYAGADQAAVIRQICDLMPQAQAVVPAMDSPDMYYRTDHHLTAEGASAVYTALCDAWGLTPQPAPRTRVEGMRGSYYARIPSPLIPQEALTVDIPEGLLLTIDGESAPILNAEKLQGRNKYAALLRETYAHAVFTGGEGTGRLLILSDSYANAVAPLLSQHFARVDVIDPRYFAGDLSQVAREAGSDRLLVLMGLNIFSENRGLALLNYGEE